MTLPSRGRLSVTGGRSRVVFYLRSGQKQRLKKAAKEAKLSVSDLVASVLVESGAITP